MTYTAFYFAIHNRKIQSNFRREGETLNRSFDPGYEEPSQPPWGTEIAPMRPVTKQGKPVTTKSSLKGVGGDYEEIDDTLV